MSAATREVLGGGLNPLVRAATPLLLLAAQVRGMLAPPDVAALRRHTMEEMRRFEQNAGTAGVPAQVVRAGRYALCAALDEAVLSTPWGAHSEWAQQSLLVALHREAWGGEKFFDVLAKMAAEPERHLDLIELHYLCITFGFAGKYQVSDGGSARLLEIQHDVYRLIRDHRGVPPAELSLRWRGVQDRRNPLIRYVPWWVIAAAALGILATAFTFFRSSLNRRSDPVHAQLAAIGKVDLGDPPPAPTSGRTVKSMLESEERRQRVRIEERGGRTLVTLIGNDLFPSGSATLNPAYDDTLRQIATAVAGVPGRVVVRGHTDSQPIASFRYTDNFQLSRDRATTVMKALGLQQGVRVEGAGSTDPLVNPEVTPEDRARNRRVEIIHTAGG